MKNAYLWVILGAVAAIAACNPNKADLPAAVGRTAHVQYLNLLATDTTAINEINFYVNGTRQNTYQILYGINSGYFSVASGSQNILFKDILLNPVFSPAATITIPVDSSTFYLTARSANGLIYSRDTAIVDTAHYKPKIRFIHASPDGAAYDLVVNTVTSANVVKSSVSVSNAAYKSISAFLRPDTGKVIINLNAAGTGTTVLTRTYTLTSNKVYTMYVYGSVKGINGAGLNLGVIANR